MPCSTLGERQSLNENLEAQIATRTQTLEVKYHDLSLLHAVAELSTGEREPDRLAPGMLRLIAAHYGFHAIAIVTTPKARTPATYVVPAGVSLPWLATGIPPADWRQRDIVYLDRAVATLFHPHTDGIDEQVMEALDNGHDAPGKPHGEARHALAVGSHPRRAARRHHPGRGARRRGGED